MTSKILEKSELRECLRFPEAETRRRIVQAAEESIVTVHRRRLRDLERIREAYRSEGCGGLGTEGARDAILAMREHVAEGVALVRPFEGKDRLTWNQQFVPAAESHYGQWLTRQVIGYSARYEPEILRTVDGSGNPADSREALFRLAAEDAPQPDSLADGPEGLSSYEAKCLLVYHLPLRSRSRLFQDLELRFDLRDVLPSDALRELVEARGRSAYGFSVLMDGYFYGALRPNTRVLLGERPGEALSGGADCSTWVQWAYERSGYPPGAFHSPISTGSMIEGDMPGFREGIFEVKRLRGESELRAGDAILWPGHVQVFLGRDDQNGLRVAEAVGRRFKTVRESGLPVSEVLGGSSAFENPDRPMYLFRPRFEPGIRIK